ncbi:MAG: hypothetical protein J0665_18550 [Deltaproteobacteria bacterium]|nr:hypothetical protein [Deltaproteobacteria bacterium]
MRMARCTLDNITYNATDFSQTADMIIKRSALTCIECGVQAFFRRQGRDGREACFFATHAEDCRQATLLHTINTNAEGNGDDGVFTTGQRIIVNFNVGTTGTNTETQPIAGSADHGGHIGQQGGGTAPRDYTYRGLRSLLLALIDVDDFRRSTQMIEIENQGDYAVSELFINFTEATADYVDSYHGFWGELVDAERHGNALYFNSGGRNDISALLDVHFIEEFYRRYNITSPREIAGAHILVFGQLTVSSRGKKLVVIEDPSLFTLRLAR